MNKRRTVTLGVIIIASCLLIAAGHSNAQTIAVSPLRGTSIVKGSTPLIVGQQTTIRWRTTGIPADADLTIALIDTRPAGDSAANWVIISTNKNTGALKWTVSQVGDIQMGGFGCYKVAIYYYNVDGTSAAAGLSRSFSISHSRHIEFLSPNDVISYSGAGELATVWNPGSYHIGQFVCKDAGEEVSFALLNAITGERYRLPGVVKSVKGSNSAPIIVTDVPLGHYRVKATLAGTKSQEFDLSGSVVIQEPNPQFLTISRPAAGDTITSGSKVRVGWFGAFPQPPNDAVLQISVASGETGQLFQELGGVHPTDGAFDWTVNLPPGQYAVVLAGAKYFSATGWFTVQ